MIRELLARTLAHSLAGDPWHGPSLATLIADLSEEEAAAHPIPGAHSILELVLHVGSWIEETTSRLEGRAPGQPVEGDWPEPRPWHEARERLNTALASLLDVLAEMPESRLAEIAGEQREAALGTGVSYATMLVGLAEHHAYHGGQIALLKRALRGPAR